MKAITVEPKQSGTIRLEDVAEPDSGDGSVLVEAIAVGVCGTDVEIAEGKYGWAPQGKTRLVLGHESLGRVIDPGPRGRLKAGDLVVGIVRRPDPLPCPNCAVRPAALGLGLSRMARPPGASPANATMRCSVVRQPCPRKGEIYVQPNPGAGRW